VETLKEIYEADVKAGRAGEYVNAADRDLEDGVVKDAWNTLGRKIKADAEEVFGRSDWLPVRRDMLNDALGYRSSSLTDPWGKTSRWSEGTREAMRGTLEVMMGEKAYQRLARFEGGAQDLISYAKTTIVVRSLVVALDNIFSNGLHLMLRGIDPVNGFKGMRSKFVEITQYVENQEKIIRMKADLASGDGQGVAAQRLRARIWSLEDANAKMSIKPLIDAGEFNTISESLTEEDLAVRGGASL